MDNQMQYLNTMQEYNRQITQLLDMAEKADRAQIGRLSDIMKKLKSSLQKFSSESGKFRRYISSPPKFEAMLKPYKDFLEGTKAEIEKAGGRS